MERPDAVRHIVNEASFGTFYMGLIVISPVAEMWKESVVSHHLSTKAARKGLLAVRRETPM